jgi:hypothetical protein
MAMTDTAMAVPHSAGTRRPARMLPPLACDSHMHIFDARFAPSPHWPRTPPQADVAMYRQLQQRLGTSRAVVVTPSTYGTDNACTLDALDRRAMWRAAWPWSHRTWPMPNWTGWPRTASAGCA